MIELLLLCSAVILIVMALRLIFRDKVSSKIIYCLWLLAATCLLVSPVVYLLTGGLETLVGYTVAGVPVGSLAALVWMAGALALSAWFVTTGWFFRKDLRKNATPLSCAESPVPVWVSPELTTPCLVGLFRPAVYLTPAAAEDGESCRHVLAHELTHLRHADHVWSFVRRLCLCVYWFHPLVWLAVQQSRQDSELACDEGALKRLGEEQRLAYGKTIVDLAVASRKNSRVASLEAEASKAKKESQSKEPADKRRQIPLLKWGAGLVVCAALAVGLTMLLTISFQTQPPVELKYIQVEQLPYQKYYVCGQSLNSDGLILRLTYADGTEKQVSDGFACSPTQLDTSGRQSIAVSYGNKTASFSVTVAEIKTTGQCGPSLKWMLSTQNDLFIEGSGPMYKYTEYQAPWSDFRDRISCVFLPEGLTSIGAYAFSGCKRLQTIQIPTSVTHIGVGAFYNAGLLTVQIPSGVRIISEKAFCFCGSLQSVTLPAELTKIEYAAFEGCSKLSSVTIPDTVTSIGSSAFQHCNSLTQVTIPGSVVSVGDPFGFCKSLSKVTLSEGIERVYLDGFWGCDNLKTLHIPASVKTLSMEKTENVALFQAIHVAPDNSEYASDAHGVIYTQNMRTLFYYPRGRSGSYSIHDGCREIGEYAFAYSKQLKEVLIPDGVREIGKSAFSDCFKLESLQMPETVRKVGNRAFSDCLVMQKLMIQNPTCQIDLNIYCSLGEPEVTTICGHPDSTAWEYAQKYGYKFAVITEERERW